MTNKKKIYIFFASALLVAVLMLLLFMFLGNNKKVDKNGMFKIDTMYFEQQDELTSENIERFIEKLNSLQADYLTPSNKVFYTIVPDKSYFITDSGYPVPDYVSAINSVTSSVHGEYIDITSSLALTDYYTTDPHWRQESLQRVLDTLGGKMGFSVDLSTFTQNKHDNFIGSYGKNLEGKLASEPLIYLENDAIKNGTSQVFGRAKLEAQPIYNIARLTSKTPYDLFLSGATPLAIIENSKATTDKELVIFRDSYASSLAPLLMEGYKKITLIDLRYMASTILPDYVTFDNQDVLFMYSTPLIANSLLLR